ncbi:transcriptional regulator [Halopenitus sp. POP-27]|uniref:transcriptional regulator n=1 Tax=Halopenitus sp. POP-27 TaxID=2994425 RepID=UPI002468512A|nr:transcriptional regulator [Halopenitus sp. POP-27]
MSAPADDRTTRQRIADRLRDDAATASGLAEEFAVPVPVVYEHLEHVAESVEPDERFLAAPPTCPECGFDRFETLLSRPSRCPECRCERLEEPAYRIDGG